jgi:hypothetical protein
LSLSRGFGVRAAAAEVLCIAMQAVSRAGKFADTAARFDGARPITNWTESGIPALPGRCDAYTLGYPPKIAGEVAKLPQ